MITSSVLQHIDNVLFINNHNFNNYVHVIYPNELEIMDTTESDMPACYLDILFNIDSNGRLTITLYDKHDALNYFPIVNFPFLCSNIHVYHFHLLMECIFPSWFDMQEHVLRMRTFQTKANYWQYSWCCRFIPNFS
jgi:hypothetical protein